MKNFYNFPREDIKGLLTESNIAECHANNLYSFIYKSDFNDIPNKPIPKRIKAWLMENFGFNLPEVVKFSISEHDNSMKFLLLLHDGNRIESVLIPEKNRLTLCISTQVGCRQGCVFCQTGRMGLIRNLTTDEIVGQLIAIQKWIKYEKGKNNQFISDNFALMISNIVYMGMGEPLDNCHQVIASAKIFIDQFGLSIPRKKVTISTAGHLHGLENLISADLGVSIALSLHEPVNSQRSKIMPINKSYPISEVLSILKKYTLQTNKHIFIQYTLIENVNDSKEKALSLVALLRGMSVKVNLIPLNPIAGTILKKPSLVNVRKFYRILVENGITTMIRFSKGPDIIAACGQLYQ